MPIPDPPRSIDSSGTFAEFRAWLSAILHHPATAWAILGISLLLTVLAWYISNNAMELRAQDRFRFKTEDFQEAIQKRLIEYEQVLRGGAGLFKSFPSVDRGAWQNYVASLRIGEYWPGIQGIGFSVRVPPEEKEAHIQRIRAEGFPEYNLRPEGTRPEYHSIIYLEPFDTRNRRAFGYDMFSEATRRKAMERARDTGQTSISGMVTLVQETTTDVQRGFLMYFPLYQGSQAPADKDERAGRLTGFVYAPFRIKDFMRGLLGTRPTEVDFEVFDEGRMSPEAHLYSTDDTLHLTGTNQLTAFNRSTNLEFGGHTWGLYFKSSRNYLSLAEQSQPFLVATGGLVVDLMLFAIIASLGKTQKQARTLAEKMTDELRQANKRFQARENQVRQIIDAAHDAFIAIDSQGRITDWNPQAVAMFEWTRDEALGQSMAELIIPPALRKDHHGGLHRFLTTGDGPILGKLLEVMALRRNGTEFPIELIVTPIRAADQVIFTAFARDISERKRAAESLTKSEEQFRSLSEAAPIGIFLTNADGKCHFSNSRWKTITGLTSEEILGRGWTRAIHPSDWKMYFEEFTASVREKRDFVLEFRVLRPDDQVRWILLRFAPIGSQLGQAVTYVGVAEEISGRKKLETEMAATRDAALESARLKSEFLANMSHEIRTPMNGVVGMVNLLLDTELTPVQRDYAETVSQSAEALLTIINEILDFSKIEAGKLKFEAVDFDLRRTIKDAVAVVAESARAKGVEMACRVESAVPAGLRGDPGRLRQVILNLVNNAVKFTARGTVTLRAAKETETASHAVIRVTVSDTGIGIAPEAQKLLFQAFSQADGSSTREYGGTGLGLAISKRLVELMGGQIGLESVAGQGSTFWFTVRMEKVKAGESPLILA
ncbi:MAG: CHASE domain-containing protein [Verrucomicrobia bacterium]|nr:CHASE domain-containing protein [Verrucomicrobiota bacterium]